MRPRSRECVGYGLPDSGASAGDKRGFLLEIEHCFHLLHIRISRTAPSGGALPFFILPHIFIQLVERDGSLALLTEALDAKANNVAST